MSEMNIRNETGELRLLFEVSRALDGASDISDHLDAALALMARYTGMMRGTLLLVDPENKNITVEAAHGVPPEALKKARYSYGEGIIGRVVQSGEPMMVPNVAKDPFFLNRTGARDIQKEDIAFICVPITIDGKTIGALSADRLFADSVCLEEDMRLLQVLASLIARAVRTRQEVSAMQSAVVEENRRLQTLLHTRFSADNIIGSSAAMRAVLDDVIQVTGTGATVLIRGESGTGKELVAGAIHANSGRSGRPFIKVNCAALPEGLVESELFGHERGAFSGAVDARKGRFEMAHGGTLFLDEVGDMTPLTQAKLLRALQEKEFERVGGTRTIRVDVRLIAATNRSLEEMVAKGEFRQDLYYRLSVFPIILPPLRERREDIMPLASHFVEKAAKANNRKILHITPAASSLLIEHEWPGNIRELENVIERAVILCGADGIVDVAHMPLWMRQNVKEVREFVPGSALLDEAVAHLEVSMIRDALTESGGNMIKAADRLGVTVRILGLRMKKYHMDYKEFRHSQ